MIERKILVSEKAINQINEIYAYIKQNSKDNAVKVRRKIKETIANLSVLPEAYPRDWFLDQTVGEFRFALVFVYKIVFEVSETEIIILQIFHTAQNPDKLSNSENE